MAFVLSDKAQTVLTYLQANPGADATHKVIAAATGLEPKSVVGTITGLVKRGLVIRTEVEGVEGKIARLTSAGSTFDPQTEVAE